MFKKIKLKPYLLISFISIILLTAVLTTGFIFGLLKTQSTMNDVINTTLAAESAVKTCRISTNVAARDLRELVLTNDKNDYAPLKENIENNINVVKQQIEIFKSTYGEEDGLAAKYETACNEWFGIADKVIEAVDNGNDDQATLIILTQCTPALNNMVAIVKDIDTKTTALTDASEIHTTNTVWFFIIGGSILFVVTTVLSLIMAFRTTKNITSVTQKIDNAVSELSKGDLNTNVDYVAKNEFGELADNLNFSFKELSRYVRAIDSSMKNFAEGNFAENCTIDFLGDFKEIKTSMQNFQNKMNSTLEYIKQSSEQVSIGASQVADGSVALAQGTTEQASSVETLSQSIEEISKQISETASNSNEANELSKQTETVVNKSKEEMAQMVAAINDISTASYNIQKIIKAIDDIAFQTNIIALNAAVEAARAGTAGKGFAIVADEVRNLAQKSSDAAKDTTNLITASLKHVERGQKLAQNTDAAFNEVASHTNDISLMISKISSASDEQANAIAEVTRGIEQISTVIQTNSATSQESAAASEELSGQASTMQSLVGEFKILSSENQNKDSNDEQSPTINLDDDYKYSDNTDKDKY